VRLSAFRHHYNVERSHSALNYLTPLAFKTAWREAQAQQQAPKHWDLTSLWLLRTFRATALRRDAAHVAVVGRNWLVRTFAASLISGA
jgi:uncharacterized membrane protein